jgi:hypothetical protein
LSEILDNSTVPLSDAVKAMAMRTYEDYTKVKSTYSHFAALAWDEINRQYIGSKIEKSLLPVHQGLKTVSIPLGAKDVVFVGLIDDCGYKIPLTNKGKITSGVPVVSCEEKCTSCNQIKDICEQLVDFPLEETVVNIDGQDYVNTTKKYFENGVYFIKKIIWAKDYVSNTVKEVLATEFIENFDMLECGCIAPTETNIGKIKDNCYSCYCSCYAPCRESEYDLGGYKVFKHQGIIQLEKNIGYDKIYVEWRSGLPRVNGELVLPEEAFESVIQGGIYFSTQHKKNVPLGVIDKNFKAYKIAKSNMHIERCRITLDAILKSATKIPKFDLSLNISDCFLNVISNSNQAVNNTQPAFIPPIPQVSGNSVFLIPYTSEGLGEDFIVFSTLINKNIFGVFKDGQGFIPVNKDSEFDTSKKQFKYFPDLGKIQFSIPFYGTEDAFVQYY